MLLIVDEVEDDATELDAAMFVVLVAVVDIAVTRKSSISTVLCFEAVNILDPQAAWKVGQSTHNFLLH